MGALISTPDDYDDEKRAGAELSYLFREQAAWLDAPGRLEKHQEYLLTRDLNRLKAGLKLSEPSPSEAYEMARNASSYRRLYQENMRNFEEMKSEVRRMEKEEATGTWKSSVISLQKQIIEILKERGEEPELARIREKWLEKEEQE